MATEKRGSTIELPWTTEKDEKRFILTCFLGMHNTNADWSLYEENGNDSKTLWNEPWTSPDLALLYDMVIMYTGSNSMAKANIPDDLKRDPSIPYEEPAPNSAKPTPSGSQTVIHAPAAPAAPPQPVNRPAPNHPVANQPLPNQPLPNQPYNPSAPYPYAQGGVPAGQPYPYPIPSNSEQYPPPSGVPPAYQPPMPPGYPPPVPGQPYPSPMMPPPGWPYAMPCVSPSDPNQAPGYNANQGRELNQPVALSQSPAAQPSVVEQPGPGKLDGPGSNRSSRRSHQSITVDINLLKQKPNILLGTLLSDAELITEPTLEAALKIQELVRSGKISTLRAPNILKLFFSMGAAIEDYIDPSDLLDSTATNGSGSRNHLAADTNETAKVNTFSSQSAKSATDDIRQALAILLKAELISQVDIDTASAVRQKHGGDLAKILLAAGKIDEAVLSAALIAASLINEGLMKVEQCVIALNFCSRSRVSFDEALTELNWVNPRQAGNRAK